MVKYFESQREDEEVLLLIKRHLYAIFPEFAITFVMYIVGFIGIFIVPTLTPMVVEGFAYNVYVLVISLIFLFSTIFMFNNWLLNYMHVAILTTEHFVEIEQTSLFSRKISVMTLEKIQDVSSSQNGLINTLLNIGSLEVQTAGEAPNFVVEYASRPSEIAHKIMEAEEAYRDGVVSAETEAKPKTSKIESEPTIEYPEGECK